MSNEPSRLAGPIHWQSGADLLPRIVECELSSLELPRAMGETLAHLEYLVGRGQALRREQDGLVFFAALSTPQDPGKAARRC